jgi:hypothetical protein
MDSPHAFDDDRIDDLDECQAVGEPEEALAIGVDERRMHVRAYNYWVSLLRGRAFPAIEDLDPENIADFGPHSVLVDFSTGIEDPLIAYLGAALREECAMAPGQHRISAVPARSLLSRLTDHYLQIIANKAPIGFEAEFVGTRGHNTLYRGILMPFSSTGEAIDFIYGVINWKELVDETTQAQLHAEVAGALRETPRDEGAAVWADGPSASEAALDSLDGRLTIARQTAAAALLADTRSRAALYRALARAYDFALAADEEPDAYAELLAIAGLTVQARAPMTPIVKLVFGSDYDKTRVTEFAAVLTAAKREGIAAGELAEHLDALPGGIKALVAAERAQRAPKSRPAPRPVNRAPIARVALPIESAAGDLVVLLARAGEGGTFDIVGSVTGNDALTQKVARAAA